MEALFARLSHYCEIGEEERDAIYALPIRERSHEPGDDIIQRGEEPDEALVIKSGWAARYIALSDGQDPRLSISCFPATCLICKLSLPTRRITRLPR